MRTIIAAIGLIILASNGFGQTDFYRIGLNIGVDYGYGVTNFSNNEIYNSLNEKQKQQLGAHLKVDFYINKNWGIYLKVHGISLINKFSEKELNAHFQSFYGSEYYINNSEFYRNEDADRPAYSFVSLGGVYQITHVKWIYHFSLGAGVALLDNPEYSYVMKIKGANQYYKKELQLKTKNVYNFYFEPSVKVSYQLNSRFQLFLSGLYTVIPNQFLTLHDLETDLYTGSSNEEKVSTRSWQQIIQLGLGLNIRLWKAE